MVFGGIRNVFRVFGFFGPAASIAYTTLGAPPDPDQLCFFIILKEVNVEFGRVVRLSRAPGHVRL